MARPGPEAVAPRIRVAAAMVVDGRFVLVRHRFGDNRYHLLPGGGVEPGESLQQALQREVLEETGLVASLVKPLFISDSISPDGARHVVNITFLAEVTAGEITQTPGDSRVEAVELVTPDALADLDLRPPIAAALAEAYAEGFAGGARYLGSLWVEDPS